MKLFLSFIFGLIFGLGLIISQMTNPDKVINFLTFGPNWDGSLMLVMASAMAVMIITWRWVFKKEKPLADDSFSIPNVKTLDAKLISGAAIFGLGWGLSGICPGPGLVQLTSLQPDFWLFFVSLIGGMFVAKKVR